MKKTAILLSVMMITLAFSINYAYAINLSLEVKLDKQTAQIGEEITVTVDWKEKMQAADYILKYDNTKLEYVKASVEDTYINKTKEGQIGISWFSGNNTDLTQMTFTFKVIAKGTAEVSVQVDGGFSDGQMQVPESYDVETSGKKTITLTEKAAQNPNENNNNNNQGNEQSPSGDNNNNQGNEQNPSGGSNNNQENEQNPSGGSNNNQGNEQNPSGGSNNNQGNEQNPSGSSNNNQQNSNQQKTNTLINAGATTANKQLPKTGDNIVIISIIGVLLVTFAIIFYRKSKKYKGI